MRIAIVDDNLVFAERIKVLVSDFFQKKSEMVITLCMGSGPKLLEKVKATGGFDLYLLDVEMPQLNGLQLTERLREYDKEARVVLITSHEHYAISSIKLETYYYILKDEIDRELPRILERIYREDKESIREYIMKDRDLLHRIPIREILFLTKADKYTVFHCVNKQYSERKTLEKVYECLPQKQFVYVERGMVVNMEKVNSMRNKSLELVDGRICAISRRFYPAVMEKLTEYLGLK